ncbi:aminoglycoside phosphotransferase family protein [Candidatus Dependentiae bacterium]|nr:aminoglycoside phosphotransferase family protein [Candidatus Dependentiae bacterium]
MLEKTKEYDYSKIFSIVSCWNISLDKIFQDMQIEGSPERSDFRTVISDKAGKLYVLEKLKPDSFNKRKSIAEYLKYFFECGVRVIPFIQNSQGDFISNFEDDYWMISAFKYNKLLDRNNYWKEGWRGKNTAEVLCNLYRASDKINIAEPLFLLEDYVFNLKSVIKYYFPELHNELIPIYEHLENEFWDAYKVFPRGFCHGDPHPLNILWSDDQIIALIDWEFSGIKPRLYDIALVIGCVGSESKKSLNAEFCNAFKKEMKEQSFIDRVAEKYLKQFMTAIRFGWLSEWLRRNDEEMIRFEIMYMSHILELEN